MDAGLDLCTVQATCAEAGVEQGRDGALLSSIMRRRAAMAESEAAEAAQRGGEAECRLAHSEVAWATEAATAAAELERREAAAAANMNAAKAVVRELLRRSATQGVKAAAETAAEVRHVHPSPPQAFQRRHFFACPCSNRV